MNAWCRAERPGRTRFGVAKPAGAAAKAASSEIMVKLGGLEPEAKFARMPQIWSVAGISQFWLSP